MENVSTMSPALVGRNFSSVDILLTFTLCQCNVMTLLNNLSGTGARWGFLVSYLYGLQIFCQHSPFRGIHVENTTYLTGLHWWYCSHLTRTKTNSPIGT